MQRIFNVTKWERLSEGKALSYPSDRPRVVRLEVNSRAPVGLYLLDPASGEAVFLATTCGRDTVEFHVGGGFSLVADGECFVYSADGQTIHRVNPDPVVFTRIAERRSVSPEIAAMTRMMNLNIERRLAAQRSEFNELVRRIEARPRGRVAEASEPAVASVPDAVASPAEPDRADGDEASRAGGVKRGKAK